MKLKDIISSNFLYSITQGDYTSIDENGKFDVRIDNVEYYLTNESTQLPSWLSTSTSGGYSALYSALTSILVGATEETLIPNDTDKTITINGITSLGPGGNKQYGPGSGIVFTDSDVNVRLINIQSTYFSDSTSAGYDAVSTAISSALKTSNSALTGAVKDTVNTSLSDNTIKNSINGIVSTYLVGLNNVANGNVLKVTVDGSNNKYLTWGQDLMAGGDSFDGNNTYTQGSKRSVQIATTDAVPDKYSIYTVEVNPIWLSGGEDDKTGYNAITGVISGYSRMGAYNLTTNNINCRYDQGDILTGTEITHSGSNPVTYTVLVSYLPVGQSIILKLNVTSNTNTINISFGGQNVITIVGTGIYYLGFISTISGKVSYVGYKKSLDGDIE